MGRLFSTVFDINRRDSLTARLRRRRQRLFWAMIADLPQPVRILDIGGTEGFWQCQDVPEGIRIEVTLANLESDQSSDTRFRSFVGDARNLYQVADQSYDVAFSNSVIEHVGTFADQQAMAREMARVAPRFYVQTPCYYFPLEPHYLVPGFQWLPKAVRVFLLSHFRLGTMWNVFTKEEARYTIDHTRLLTARQLRKLFPGARILRERLFGLTKSYIVCRCYASARAPVTQSRPRRLRRFTRVPYAEGHGPGQ